MSKQSDQVAHDTMVARLLESGVSGRELGYVIDMVMNTYKQIANLSEAEEPPKAGTLIYEGVRADLTSRGLQQLIDPVVTATENYVKAILHG
jgi:hypothetical protein